MKKIIKKILGEQKTPKFDYIRKVAKLIAYYDIEVDIENRNIAVPFVGVLGQTEYYNSEPFLVYYKDDYLITNEIPVYVFNKYGLDIKSVNNTIKAAFAGASAGLVYEGEKQFDLVRRV